MKGFSPIEGNPQKQPEVILGSAVMQNTSSYKIKAMLPTLLCKTNRQLHPTRRPQVQICKSKQNKDCREFLQTKPKLLKGLVSLSVKCGHNFQFCHIGMCQGKVCDENWGTTFCHLHLTGELTQDKPFLLPDVTSDQARHPPNPVTVLTSAIAKEIINKTAFFIRSTAAIFLALYSTGSLQQLRLGAFDLSGQKRW